MAYRFATPIQSELPEIWDFDRWAFPDPGHKPGADDPPYPCDPDRTWIVRDEPGRLVAMHASYDFADYRVPGSMTRVAGLTWVGVHPEHRRRGLLRQMMAKHFEDCAARGEAISALTAAESAIYGRFGYGLALKNLSLDIPRSPALRDVPGVDGISISLDLLEPERDAAIVASVLARVDRPGQAPRTNDVSELLFRAFIRNPQGFETPRIALASRDDETLAYAVFSRANPWGGPVQGRVHVWEWCATDAAARAALLKVMTDLDLMKSTRLERLAMDDPVQDLLVDLRSAKPSVSDGVWLRLVDVPAALGARRYLAPLDVVLDLTDDVLPANAGRWALRVDGNGVGQAERTERDADLALDVRDLGASYLGGTTLAALAGAGLVRARDAEALRAASLALSWSELPACNWMF